ncbi:DUF4349 domain-containing protein [Nonomuraea turkmeniaca]|uniref:DUF4349 domain-containing protein n=1 Tax=Nonomuraea turkmeniaca TaxID=103838 RepID=A0A5S4FRL9_9ACTN|nr:DUF4349 domain-containing protein [Nonomuraea turkmeniaca]TMR23342.1 DUF4349 domain-containing protein [Nonomuraea turkmeniaca]
MRRIRYGIALSAACGVLLLTGCGGGFATEQSGAAPAPASLSEPETAVRDQAVQEQAKPQQTGGDGIVSNVKVTQQNRQVIYTGSMSVRVKKVATAVAQAKQIVTTAGGYLSKEESSSANDSRDSATLEFKIPPNGYGGVLERLGKDLGIQLSMNQTTQDVTLRIADVNSRLKSAEQALESLRSLLKRADTIGQVLQVEREISTREADLESLQAQQKELAAQVSMATLTLQLFGPVAVVEEPEEEPAGFLGGLKSGWNGLVSFTKVVLTVLGALLPWTIAALPLVALLVYLVRRDRARRPRIPTPPPGPRPGDPGPETA